MNDIAFDVPTEFVFDPPGLGRDALARCNSFFLGSWLEQNLAGTAQCMKLTRPAAVGRRSYADFPRARSDN